MGLKTLFGLKRRLTELPRLDLAALPAMLGRSDPTILEIGANDGWDSRRFVDLFPSARLYCFEPDARAISDWRSRMGGTSATLIEAAVGAKSGVTTFHVSSGRKVPGRKQEWHKSGSIHRPTGHLKAHPWVRFEETATVQIISLDEWSKANEIGPVDFIWADVQGAERDLIYGARDVLRRTRYFYTEYSDVELYASQPTLAEIEDQPPGFRLLTRYPKDALFINGCMMT